MGSLRNPVGPLPSTIYWRRRVAVSAAVVVIAALVVWAVTRGGGGDAKNGSTPAGSHTPVGTITAGPTPSGTHISGRPGGRDTAPPGTDGGNTAGDTAGSGDTAGDDTAGSGDGTTAGSAGGTDTGGGTDGGTSGGTGSAGGTGVQVPAGSTLPNCTSGTVALTLATDLNQYPVGQYPKFTLRAANSGAADCKLDVGAVSAVLDVTKDPDNSHVWASDDCPASKSPYLIKVPAHSAATYTVPWNGRTSSPGCASPKGASAAPGNYLAQVTVPGFGVKQRSFSLSAS